MVNMAEIKQGLAAHATLELKEAGAIIMQATYVHHVVIPQSQGPGWQEEV